VPRVPRLAHQGRATKSAIEARAIRAEPDRQHGDQRLIATTGVLTMTAQVASIKE
jgi:hypothetical protein